MKKEINFFTDIFLNKILVLLIFSAFLPVINFNEGTLDLEKTLLEFAFNIALIFVPLSLFAILLKNNIIKKNNLMTQVWTAIFAYAVLFAFCFFNAIIFVDVLDVIFKQYIFSEASIGLVVLRWLIAIVLFFMLTDILMKLFTYVRILNEKKTK